MANKKEIRFGIFPKMLIAMTPNGIITPQGDPSDSCDPMGNPAKRDKGG